MNQFESTTFDTYSNIDEFIKINMESDLFESNEEPYSNGDLFTSYFQKLQPQTTVTETSSINDEDYLLDAITNINDSIYTIRNTTSLMFGVDPLESEDSMNGYNAIQNELHQIITDESVLPSLASSSISTVTSSTSSVNEYSAFNEDFTESNYTTEIFSGTLDIKSLEHNSPNHSPLSITTQDQIQTLASRGPSPTVSNFQYTPETSPMESSVTPQFSSAQQLHAQQQQQQQQNLRKSSLDSRLSLQRLGEILKTSSSNETMKIEKFILNVFGKELGFPLGYKTWIRDTNENYRRYLLDEVYKRVNPTYPELTKPLLETVIKRATYSMMQGRLRKERRALSKANKRKNFK